MKKSKLAGIGRIFFTAFKICAMIYFTIYLWNFFNVTRFFLTEDYKLKHFRFEHYGSAEEMQRHLYQLHPVGSNVKELIKTLGRADARVKLIDSFFESHLNNFDKNNQHLYYYYPTGFCKHFGWEIHLRYIDNKITDIVSYRYHPLA